MQSSKIPVTLVGLGRIASLLEKDPLRRKPCTHAGVVFGSFGKKHFHFANGVDLQNDRLELFAKDWKVNPKSLFSEIESLPPPQNPNHLLVVSTDSESHFPLAVKALEKGYRFLLIEKPVALRKKDALSLLRLEKQKRATIWVNHERRYHPHYQFAKANLMQGNWGKVKRVVANVFTSSKNPGMAFTGKGGGPLFHDGTHALDLVQWFFPTLQINWAKSFQRKKNQNPERVIAWLSAKPEVEILFEVSGGRDYFQFELDIMTTSHRIVLSNDGFQFLQSMKSSLYQGFNSLVASPFPFPKRILDSAFIGVYQEIVDVIKKNQSFRECSLQDNIEILAIMEKIQKGNLN